MRVLGQSIATLLLLVAVFVCCAGMQRPPGPALATPPPLAVWAPPIPVSAAASRAPVSLAADLVRVHVARAPGRVAVMMDFSSQVRCETDHELTGNRFGILVSPVERSGLSAHIKELSALFSPIEVESESAHVHRLTLTLPEGVSPSEQCRVLAAAAQTHILDFEDAGEDRSAEAPEAVPQGRLTAGQKASRGRGFSFYQYRWMPKEGNGSDVFVHRVDPARGDFDVRLALARGRIHARQTLSAIAQSGSALAAINAGFFAIHGNGDPLGLLVADGRLLSAPVFGRSAVGLFPGGRVLFGNPELSGRVRTRNGQSPIEALNQARTPGKLVLYTHDYGARTGTEEEGVEFAVAGGKVIATGSADLAIPQGGFVVSFQGPLPASLRGLGKGDAVDFQVGLTPPWNSSLAAIGAGPRLLSGGQTLVTYDEEKFRRAFAMERAPRTGIGLTATGKLLLIAVDGRKPRVSAGVSLTELAAIFKSLGATDALNMDGGGSTTSWLAGHTVNRPSDGRERPISSALLVVPRGPARLAVAREAPAPAPRVPGNGA